MRKIAFKDIKNMVSSCALSLDLETLTKKPFSGDHHIHEWDHGYESWSGYNGPRREFYSDMRDMLNFLLDYFETTKISEIIIAPIFSGCQFSSMRSYPEKTKSLYEEIREFLKTLNIRSDSRCGVQMDVKNNTKLIEMVFEGAFLDDVSMLRIFSPSASVIINLTHHFDMVFFTPDFEKEKVIVTSLLKRHPNLKYYERTDE